MGDARVTSIKNKIFNATGIRPHRLDITRVSISTKRVKLAWVCFEKAKTVSEIFRLAVQNGNLTKFNAFPHVPAKAMSRKEGLEKILKNLQAANNQFRYQIRLGLKDLEVWVKNHQEYDYKPYRRIEISSLDPNNKVPDWDLKTKDINVPEKVNPFDAGKGVGKRGAVESPEGYRSKRSNVDEWQVQEFVWAFLEGTATTPNYTNLTWELEDGVEDEIQIEEEATEAEEKAEELTDSEAEDLETEGEDLK